MQTRRTASGGNKRRFACLFVAARLRQLLRKQFYYLLPGRTSHKCETLIFPEKKMNGQKRKTVITVEKFQRTTVRRARQRAITAWCDGCAAETAMLEPNQAAAAAGPITAREIFRLTEAGRIHYLETEAGALLVCSASLAAFLNK
jgi:hypothetical protein